MDTKKNGIPDGVHETKYANGKLSGKANYVNGKKTGWGLTYHHSGNKASEGEYCEDKQVGIWTYWSEEGNLISIANASNEKSSNSIVFWDASKGHPEANSPFKVIKTGNDGEEREFYIKDLELIENKDY